MKNTTQNSKHSAPQQSTLRRIIVFAALLATLFGVVWLTSGIDGAKALAATMFGLPESAPAIQPGDSSAAEPDQPQLCVTVLNVGQGDSILIQTPGGKTMLIDSGEPEFRKQLRSYLDERGIKRIDIVLSTHPHSDHIGNTKMVLQNYEVGAIYAAGTVHTSATYKGVVDTAAELGLPINVIRGGPENYISLDSAVTLRVLAPLSEHPENLNNESIVIKLSYGSTSFMLTGDAEKESEAEILRLFTAQELKSDVLKMGHHGSHTSSTEAFLDAVRPRYAIMTVQEDNVYDHPHKETLEKLNARGITYYTSAANGTVTFYSDGTNIRVETEK